MTTLDATLRRIIAAYCRRRGMSARRFGRLAVADFSLGATLARGRSPRLDTADRVLTFIGAEPAGPALRREVDAFLKVTGTKRSVPGVRAARDPSFVSRLRRGASPRLAAVERVQALDACRGERKAMAAAPGGAPVSLRIASPGNA